MAPTLLLLLLEPPLVPMVGAEGASEGAARTGLGEAAVGAVLYVLTAME